MNFRDGTEDPDLWRGEVAWHMPLIDVLIGHSFGFVYPISGDHRPLSQM